MPITRPMRISGTYVERLLILWVPVAITLMLLIALKLGAKVLTSVFLFFPIMLVFLPWMIDCVILFFMALKPLRIDHEIHIGEIRLSPSAILSITPVARRFGKFDYSLVEFVFVRGSITEKICILAKPVSILGVFRGEKSKHCRCYLKNFHS